jgi:hypothetical protein
MKPPRGLLFPVVDDAGWEERMDAKRPYAGNTDQDMIAYPPGYPDYEMPEALEENLPQMPGYPVEGTLPISLRKALRTLGTRR